MNYSTVKTACLVLTCLIATKSISQKIPLIKSGEIIDYGKQLYDSNKYEASALEYLKIPKQDTNYVYALSELALTYIEDKKYDQAIQICNEGLTLPSEFGAHMWRSKGIAADRKGDFENSVKYLQEGISKYPFDYSLIYNLGITYYNHKDYEKAEDCFFRALSINPFHGGSHQNLGRLAMIRGRKTHAAFAMGIYLAVNNSDNERLVLLDKFFGNEVTDEGSVPAVGKNNCEKLDQIIRAGIAMDKKFDSKIPIDAQIVKQFELIFNQLALITNNNEDPYVNLYLSVYKAFKEKNMAEAFIYHLLASSSNEIAKKWLKKNEKTLNAFFDIANRELKEKRKLIKAPSSFQYSEPIPAWHNGKSNKLEALGKLGTGEERIGQWYFFHSNYEKSAEGKYDSKGKKIGTWKYYFSDGRIRSIENYDNGEITVHYPEGGKKEHFFMPNDEIEGVVETFYACGSLQEKLNYKKGKRDGKGQFFSRTGTKTTDYNYKEGKLDGEYVIYYNTGEVQSKKSYAGGELEGLYQEFFRNGRIRTTGQIVKGGRIGPWKSYHDNGQLASTGTYVAGSGSGEWLFYDRTGSLTEKRTFDQKGNLHGESTLYFEDKPVDVKNFKSDLLVKSAFYDLSGKELGKFESSSGTFSAKTFYVFGQLAGEGRYKKGKLDGTWIYYYPDGAKWKEYTYVDGKIQGQAFEYFKNGAKKYSTNYKDDQYDGYFQEFFHNGQVKQEGWLQKGQRQQAWKVYRKSGRLESEYYYFNGEFDGPTRELAVAGQLISTSSYKNGDFIEMEEFNEAGKKISTQTTANGKTVYEIKFSSGKTESIYETQCGQYHGKISSYFPNGSIFYSYQLVNGRKEGMYKYLTTEGKPEWTGKFADGLEEGDWQAYSSTGRLDSKGKFVAGQRDSLWTNYYITGKISSIISYKGGERNGISKYLSTDGNVMLEKFYQDGQMVAYRIFKNGKAGDWQLPKKEMKISAESGAGIKIYEENFKDGLIDGEKKIFYENGKPYSEFNYKEGDYQGVFRLYYPNGQLEEQGTYESDELNGTRKFFKEDGKIAKSEEYLLGTRNGPTIIYNNSVKASEIVFWSGSPKK